MPEGEPESQEEILAAWEASLTDADIPPDEEQIYGWLDPDTDPPAELLELTDQELDDLLEATPPQPAPVPVAWPLSYPGSGVSPWPAGMLTGEGPGRGFAQGGILDELPASMTLAGFANDACERAATLDDDCLIGAVRAWRRLASWASARELALVAELARRRPADGTPPAAGPGEFPGQISEFTADEVGTALTLTRMAGQAELDLALDLADRPAITAALESGRIDLAKARILVSMICPLQRVHADAVESAVLPLAPGLTTGELRAALLRAILAVDPDAARRRQEASQKDARVERWTEPEGTATLAGRYLPPAEVLAADKRLCAIAKSWKKQGAQGGMDLLRAHVYLALLLGQPVDTPPLSLLPAGSPVPADSPVRAEHAASGEEPGAHGRPGGLPPGGLPPAGLRPPGAGTGVPLPPLMGEVNLTVPLKTLLGLADQPGEVAGFGPVHADTARRLADAMATNRDTRWGVIVTNQDGRAMGWGGNVRARPVSAGGWKITITTEPIAPYP
ncbi:MAG TPA: DUF222 domain-containing protein [Streptosporangiaceae bacterium]